MPFRIGISTTLDHRERWRPGREYLYLDRRYSEAVVEAGGTPVLLPVGSDPLAAAEAVDALILPGGDDFPPPSPYPADVVFDPVAPAQLVFDRALLGAARARDIPILGICYGAQLMALEGGGRLHHHLPLDLPEAGAHQLPEHGDGHPVQIESGSRLAALVREGRIEVNSLHHQCIAEPGEGMRVSARAEDGVIEAIESREPVFEIGVQWHPEKMVGPAGARLFRGLLEACAENTALNPKA
jgi:putative glutamine amidotransferase